MALATSVTVAVYAICIWCIATVTCGTESPLVGLHGVELGTPVASNLVCITVFEWVALVVDRRHEHVVKCRDTATSSFAQINIILNATSKKICTEVAACVDSIDG